MTNISEEEYKKNQKDRMTMKAEEVKFISEEELQKLNIKFYNDDKDNKKE